jgi:hypothetical protein
MRRFPLPLPRSGLPRIPPPAAWRVPRPPLPLTTASLLLLLVLPAAGLLRWPRPRAEGLEQIMAAASLLQSFPATPESPVPELWTRSLGAPAAQALWGRQSRNWWQFWGPHADGAPYLALPLRSFPGGAAAPLPPRSLRVGDLVVVAPDPLSRQILADQLRPGMRRSRGLQRRCLERLEQDQAVFWNPSALGVIVGPLAPLLQRFQEGCLALAIESGSVSWSGEAASVEGVLLPAAASGGGDAVPTDPGPPLPADLLLELRGPSLEPLLQGLLARELIREPLAARYGLDAARLQLVRRAPFLLRLRPRASGPFLASLELQVSVGAQRRQWEQLLRRLAQALREQGLREQPPAPAAAPAAEPAPSREPPAPAAAPPAAGSSPSAPVRPAGGGRAAAPADPAQRATWHRQDGVVVGGWKWQGGAGSAAELVFHLGPPPPSPPAALGRTPAPPTGAGALLLRARPQALDTRGLLPPAMPLLVRRADQLWLQALPTDSATGGGSLSRLRGRLRVVR